MLFATGGAEQKGILKRHAKNAGCPVGSANSASLGEEHTFTGIGSLRGNSLPATPLLWVKTNPLW
ncbi:hypothetical protein PVBG_03538 [Plasmodium vivax Brazil I]|uniref:Uncharacterized protein n=1 Tax=Plasmodium vivax (strain Brazil I) TaxID=1033975 RepID=A0A0J9VPL6_PLAV1|nr:hypothetical protein PVBG_03538 [Plasmodium vivax Brazil I]